MRSIRLRFFEILPLSDIWVMDKAEDELSCGLTDDKAALRAACCCFSAGVDVMLCEPFLFEYLKPELLPNDDRLLT